MYDTSARFSHTLKPFLPEDVADSEGSGSGVTDGGAPSLTDSDRAEKARAVFTVADLLTELESDPAASAFSMNDHSPLLATSKRGKITQSRLVEYASQAMLSQHRCFIFMVYIVRTKARLIRWDRAGAIVSKPIDLETKPLLLLNFFARLSSLSSEGRGRDPTVIPASPADIDAFLTYAKTQTGWVKKAIDDIVGQLPTWPLYKMTCQALAPSDNSMPRQPDIELVVGKSCSDHHDLTGRATRGFIAFRLQPAKLVFVKDYWRPDVACVPLELDAYARLAKHQVRYVATAIGGGDVGDTRPQVTLTQDYLPHEKGEIFHIRRIHYRVVTDTVGHPLHTYDNSRQLVEFVLHAFKGKTLSYPTSCDCLNVNVFVGHMIAFQDAQILHGDVSAGNILIDIYSPGNAPVAFLTDWDLCKFTDIVNRGAIQCGRSVSLLSCSH